MTVTHTNRKGKTYYLHQGKTKKGNPRYFFALRDEGDLVEAIPAGYEIYESPNAQVFLRKSAAQLITGEEVAVVEAGMRKHSRLTHYIVDVKKDTVAIYTADQDAERLARTLSSLPGVSRVPLREAVARTLTYSPMLKFVLVDREARLFTAYRYCFLGGIDDWFLLSGPQGLAPLVATYVPHLGEESFYDLY